MGLNFALAGQPIAHSRSPRMHHAALEASGLSGKYTLVEGDEDVFRTLVDRLRQGDLDGLNVTMPHKGIAYRTCDRLTSEASSSGSVNTMKIEDGLLWGHSSDVTAFRLAFADMDPDLPVVVLGSGGSAVAAVAASHRPVSVWARNPERLAQLVDRFPDKASILEGPFARAVVVNCTPLGMSGEHLPEGITRTIGGLIDLPYHDEETPVVLRARETGVPYWDGIRFLGTQAAESFLWWTGVRIEASALVAAGRNT